MACQSVTTNVGYMQLDCADAQSGEDQLLGDDAAREPGSSYIDVVMTSSDDKYSTLEHDSTWPATEAGYSTLSRAAAQNS